ncbi:MAG: septum formation protein Maf [Betaproteobacteria bacterium]|nr:MAG: septum formation protein Maf [Betaproteobacteria bacterium]
MNSRPLVLASTSPYRRELLARLRIPFEVGAPGVNEAALPGEAARDTALRLAELKARAVAPKHPGALVIGSDQVAALNGECLGKPGSHEMAVSQLRAMRGRRVTFHTALALLNTATGGLQLDEVPTAVYFRDCSDEEIERYLAAERPYDCTGSAKIEGLGIALVERMVSDDPSALMGLPLMRLTAMLKQEGVSVL